MNISEGLACLSISDEIREQEVTTTSGGSSDPLHSLSEAPPRGQADKVFEDHLAALRLRNGFLTKSAHRMYRRVPHENDVNLLCFFTGIWASFPGELRRTQLVPLPRPACPSQCVVSIGSAPPRSAGQAYHPLCPLQIDAMQMLGALPDVTGACNAFKLSSANATYVMHTYHLRLNADLPGLILAPPNDELRRMIKAMETCFSAGEHTVSALPTGQSYQAFTIDLDNVVKATADKPIGEGTDQSLRFVNLLQCFAANSSLFQSN